MGTTLRWTSADLAVLPDDGKRYEIIDGDLYMSRQPHWHHQQACGRIFAALDAWSRQTGAGAANLAPGVIFAEDDDVAPDVVWISQARRATALGPEGHLHTAPELVVEVLSPGSSNERRDREVKLKLYSRRGVREYWIVDWQRRQIEVFRRVETALQLVTTLLESDTLASPLLPGFTLPLADLFAQIPHACPPQAHVRALTALTVASQQPRRRSPRDEAQPHLPRRIVAVQVHQHDVLPDPERRPPAQHWDRHRGHEERRQHVVGPVARATVSVHISLVARQQSLQRRLQVRLGAGPDLDQRQPHRGVRREHVDQPVAEPPTECHYCVGQVHDPPPRCVDGKFLALHVPIVE